MAYFSTISDKTALMVCQNYSIGSIFIFCNGYIAGYYRDTLYMIIRLPTISTIDVINWLELFTDRRQLMTSIVLIVGNLMIMYKVSL